MTTIDFDSCRRSDFFPSRRDLAALAEACRPSLPGAALEDTGVEDADRAGAAWGATVTLVACMLTVALVTLAFHLAAAGHPGLALAAVVAGVAAACILGAATQRVPGRIL